MRSPGRSGPLGRLAVLAVVAALGAGALVVVTRVEAATPGAAVGAAGARLQAVAPAPRTLDAYRGLGAWVDAFDYAPAYQASGGPPEITPTSVGEMARQGVHTLFLQVARNDPRSPGGLVDPELLAQFLVRAHRQGIRVVGWYLPEFGDVAVDLANLETMAGFEVLGHRLDGIAVDIEYTTDVPDASERSARLIGLSHALRAEVGTDALGAIVFPPVLTEVVNPELWPDFPWRALAGLYDAWLPMSYWTFRTAASGYQDGYTYNEESTRRLRANLGQSDAPVHAIGGIGDVVTADDLAAFARSLVDTGAVGGSIYDWNTLSASDRAVMAGHFASGPLASLAPA